MSNYIGCDKQENFYELYMQNNYFFSLFPERVSNMRISGLLSVRHAPVDFTVYHSGLGKYTTDYSNLPQRYIKRMITRVEWKSPNHPRYAPRCRSFVPKYHSLERPWTQGYMAKHGPGGRSVVRDNTVVVPCVEPIKEADWMWFRGDRVEILTGPDKGKQGYIDSIVQVTEINTTLKQTFTVCIFRREIGALWKG